MSAVEYSEAPAPGPGPPNPAGPTRGQPYQFSKEELRVLKECNRESFFQRCLPIGTLLGVAAYYGVQGGHLKPSPRWGPVPKVVVASIIGYFIGKMSYQSKCAEKLMQLPDSRIGALLRQRKRGAGFQESLEPGISLSPFSSVSPADSYSDVGPRNSMDLDTNRPEQFGLDDSHRPTVEDNHPVFEEESMPAPQNKITSYEELRKQNREDYQKQRTYNYKGVTTPTDVPPVRRPSEIEAATSPPPSSTSYTSPKRTNIYGDLME